MATLTELTTRVDALESLATQYATQFIQKTDQEFIVISNGTTHLLVPDNRIILDCRIASQSATLQNPNLSDPRPMAVGRLGGGYGYIHRANNGIKLIGPDGLAVAEDIRLDKNGIFIVIAPISADTFAILNVRR